MSAPVPWDVCSRCNAQIVHDNGQLPTRYWTKSWDQLCDACALGPRGLAIPDRTT